MPFLGGTPRDVDNLENYRAAVKDAQIKLEEINIDIKSAIEQRDLLVSGNHEMLKERVAEADANVASSEKIKASAQLIFDQAAAKKKYCDDQAAQIEIDKAQHENRCHKFLQDVNKRVAEFEDRELKIQNEQKDIISESANLAALKLQYEKVMDECTKQKNELMANTQKAISDQESASAQLQEAQATYQAAKDKEKEVLLARTAHAKDLEDFKIVQDEVDQKYAAAEALEAEAAEKQKNIKDLLIEQRRVADENNRMMEGIKAQTAQLQLNIERLEALKTDLVK